MALAVHNLAAIPGLTNEQADLLVHAGFLSVDDLLTAELNDLELIEPLKAQAPAIMAAVKAEADRRATVQ